MPGTIPTYPAGLYYEAAFNAAPNQATLPPWWSDLSGRTKTGPQSVQRGRQYELDVNQAGEWHATLENKDGALDPTNPASPYAPGVVPYRPCRIRALPGANTLTADQATAGDASGYLGALPAGLNIGNDFGYTVTIVASGTAYQGGRVYQVTLPSAAGAFTTVLLATAVPVVPGATYSFSAQVRIPSGTSTATGAAILWYTQSGAALTPAVGASVTPASGSSTWNTVSASGQAPSTAYSAALKIQIASGSTAAPTTWQVDGLQFEQSATATAFQVPQTLAPNMLPRAVATGTASMAATDSAADWFASGAGSIAQASGLTAAPTGSTTAAAWTSPAGTTNFTPFYAGAVAALAPAVDGPVADCVQVAGGVQYTASMYLTRASSADATLQVTPVIRWFNAAGALISASSGSLATLAAGSWVRASVTASAPAAAVWGRPRYEITTPSVTTATNTIYSTGWQMEAAGSASTWLDPGPTQYIYTGMVERWPQSWIMNGTYGVSGAIGVDALAALAQYTLQAPFVEEVLAMGPDFFYQLNDPTGSTSCADSAGKRPAAPVENSPAGAGSLTFGGSVTSTGTPGLFIGTPGPVATFANNPSQSNTQEAQTFISLHKTTATPGPPSPTGSPSAGASNPAWTRIIAFRCSTIPAAGTFPTLWMVNAASYVSDQSFYQLYLNPTSGKLSFQESGASGLGPLWTSASNLCDGNWHQVAISYTGALTQYFDVFLDGARVFHDNNSGAGWSGPTNIDTDVIGAFVVYGTNAYVLGWVGDAAHAIQFPFALSTTQAANLYTSWRSASAGESSGARASRILNAWVGWTGPTAIDTGQTATMGPATDLAGATALDALNAVALTENGNFYAGANGQPTFTARTRRYGQLNPLYVFGENAALGEWPYKDITDEYDTQHLFNIIQVTQYSTSQVATAQDATSQAAYFPRLLQRSINPGAFTEAQDAASYLLQTYKSTRLRIADLTLNPSAIPGLFAVCLSLEIGTRVRVMRRTPSAPTVQFDGFVESLSWVIDPDSGLATVQVQCSPADLSSYWLLAALHTTLASPVTAGANTATIRALPDAAVNALSQSLPSGYQLTFDPGTPIAETMTIAPGGIPATNPTYTSATLTFTSNFANNHTTGAVVCEPLPAGISDPTTYDTASVIGAASCQILSGGAAGTNTVTVGPLGDAVANALSSDWTTGDVLQLSPGTANFEGYNLLTPNQASAGEGVLPLAAGSSGSVVGVTSALGTASVTVSGSAFQGANVWQVPIAANAGLFRLIRISLVAASPLIAHTFSAYVRCATTGANPTVNAQILFLDGSGATLSTNNGATSTLTGSPSAAWTRVTVTATAPAGTVWAAIGVPLNATAPSSSWTFQADALQWEAAASASAFAVPPQVASVGACVPGYSSVQITLAANLASSHAAGEIVCDPLPPGVTSPAAIAATCRLAY